MLCVVCSCSKSKSIFLKIENAEGLTDGTKLKINGVEIGDIESINLDQKGNLLIKANIKSEFELPVDSDFKIENEGLINPKIIAVKPGKSATYLSEKDTILLKNEDDFSSHDSITIKMKELLNQISGKDKNDSILKELRRLNENLEKRDRK